MPANIIIPADVPENKKNEFIQNCKTITKNTNNLFLFAGDQKVEHLNKDFYGANIHSDAQKPTHLFEIANKGHVGVFATQLGLINRYAQNYKNINYCVKLNSKTDLLAKENHDPISKQLWTVEQVVKIKNFGIPIKAVGYTVYLGSEFENIMLQEAAKIIFQAHQEGLIAILWMYPRGKNIKDEKNANLIAGAAGIANCLGADFAKINPPENASDLQQAVMAAGNTKLICSGGKAKEESIFLQELKDQITIGGTAGCAVGRNIHNLELSKAIKMTQKIEIIIYK